MIIRGPTETLRGMVGLVVQRCECSVEHKDNLELSHDSLPKHFLRNNAFAQYLTLGIPRQSKDCHSADLVNIQTTQYSDFVDACFLPQPSQAAKTQRSYIHRAHRHLD